MAIKKYANLSLVLGLPGIIIQLIGAILMNSETDPPALSLLLFIIGIILLGIGLGMAAKSKGHPVVYGILGILGMIGLIFLALLKDKYPNGEEPCQKINLPPLPKDIDT